MILLILGALVTATDYVSTSSSVPMAYPFQKLLLMSANEIVHEE